MMKRLALLTILFNALFFAGGCSHLGNLQETAQILEEIEETEASVEEKIEVPLEAAVPEPEPVKEEVVLPRAYSYVEEDRMPVLRNQGDENSCWAYASLSALESSMDEDAAGPYATDHLILQNPFGRSFSEGGSYMVSMSYLLSWTGPVNEGTQESDEEAADEPVSVHVQEIRQAQAKDYETIKRFVYLYGGVETALYVDFQNNMEDSSYYKKETNAYCYFGENSSNHEVLIVGWDDDYPAENFLGNVTENGAFLCLNSWGENFGDEGTFYVSYEDVNIGGYGVVYSRIDPPDNYDRIFQSDLCGYTAQIGYEQESAWFANVYTSQEPINVRAVGFYATGAKTKYEIYAVPKFADEKSFDEKELLCTGFLEDAGYYTIDLPEPVKVTEQTAFAFVVKITTEGASYPVAVECPVEGLSENADISDGRGYLSYQGTSWEQVEMTKDYNICLKAYGDLQTSEND